MEKLIELTKLTKASFELAANEHRVFYEEPEEYYFGVRGIEPDRVGEIDWEKDIWDIMVYPRTPVGFVRAISNDLESLIDWAIEAAKEW
jgi:hypothetical protein